MKIHVVCANPAVDKLYAIDGFAAGEDYPGQRPVSRFGGKGVNVARVLSQLGADVRLYAFMGEESAAGFEREMETRCACTFIKAPGACRTTVNIIDRQNGRETVITECGPDVTAAHVRRLLAELEAHVRPGDWVCCSGSIISGAPEDLYAQISRLSAAKGAQCAIDCNANTLSRSLENAQYALGKPNERELCALLGAPRTQEPETIARLAIDCNANTLSRSLENAQYALGKPNERELCALLGAPRTQEPETIARLARRLMPPISALLVSLGAQGGLWVRRDGAYLARVPESPVVSTVGSGDAALAGALYALSKGLEPEQALALAMACGVANARLGEVGSVRTQDVRALENTISVIPITRGA